MTREIQEECTDETGLEWLEPTVALTRYQSSKTACAGSAELVTAQVRYGFRIGSIGLVVAEDKDCEVIDDASISPIPNTPVWLCGLLNLRGNLVPVFDLKLLFGIEQQNQDKQRLLMVDEGDMAVALRIDGLPRVVDTRHRSARLPPMPEVLREHVHAAYVHEDTIWLDVDVEAFFASLGAQIAT